jgi:Tfp pilus assembly protein PilN
MNNSAFNLLPWRERLRTQALRRWRWGLALSVLAGLWGAQVVAQWLDAGLQAQRRQHQAWQSQHQSLQAALAEAPLWARRRQEAQQVKAQWTHWQDIQNQAWRVMRQVLALPPRGVQIEHMVWREQHLQLAGWAVSAAHVQLWQDQLQAQRTDWQPALWRELSGWGVRQHRFGLTARSGGGL